MMRGATIIPPRETSENVIPNIADKPQNKTTKEETELAMEKTKIIPSDIRALRISCSLSKDTSTETIRAEGIAQPSRPTPRFGLVKLSGFVATTRSMAVKDPAKASVMFLDSIVLANDERTHRARKESL